MKKFLEKNLFLEKNYGEIVEIMLNSTKIIPNLGNLIDSGKFSVSVNSETKQLIIKKNTHHKFNFVIIFEQCIISKDSFKPSNIEIYIMVKNQVIMLFLKSRPGNSLCC